MRNTAARSAGNRWIIGFLIALVVAAIMVTMFFTQPPAPVVPLAAASPSANPATRAARRILAASDHPAAKTAGAIMEGALHDANAELGHTVFARYAFGGGQELDVFVSSGNWAALSPTDQNSLFAALASMWATTWQTTHRGGLLQNGLLMRLVDQSGKEIRRDVFRRQ